MGSVHNGFFGVFKGYNFKGVLFHQGYNNQLSSNLRPKLYRVLTKLMIEGWREEFDDPQLPVAAIGFNAGGATQNAENFEALSIVGEPWIREAQRLGVDDVEGEALTAFLPTYDSQFQPKSIECGVVHVAAFRRLALIRNDARRGAPDYCRSRS